MWVILGFVPIKEFEVVSDVHLLIDKAHESRQQRMVQQIRIVEQGQRSKTHRRHFATFFTQTTEDFRR